MKLLFKSKGFYSLVLILQLLITSWLSSCVSLRKGYLGNSVGSPVEPFTHHDTLLIETEKIFSVGDSLAHCITQRKALGQHIRANEINGLFTSFGHQLEFDRKQQFLIQKEREGNEVMSYEQYKAALNLLESALCYELSYNRDKTLRRMLNRGDVGNSIPKRALRKSSYYLYSPSIRKKINSYSEQSGDSLAGSILKNLPSTNMLKALGKGLFQHGDRLSGLINSITYAGSYLFGNTAGYFNFPIYQKENAELLSSLLQPYDIVVSKSPNHLTDKFIPGYFGHSALCIDRKSVVSYLSDSARASTEQVFMAEALRSGIKISTLEAYADADVYLIIRPVALSDEQKKQISHKLIKQLKKKYDFNFNIESPEAITCTELIYLACDYVDWKVSRTWSRYTLEPDDLVETVLQSKELEFPYLLTYKKIVLQPDPVMIGELLKSK
jgi:uncharacterized protein YycO